MYYPAPAVADPLVSPDYGGWWARGLRLLGRCFWPLLAVHLVGALVAAAVQVPLFLAARRLSVVTDGPTILVATSYIVVGLAVRLAAQAVVTVAGVHAVVARAAGAPVRVGTALGYALRRALPLFAWEFVAGLLIAVSVVLLVLPSLYVGLVVLMLPAVVAFERGSAAVPRCFKLFHASFGTALARTVTLAVLTLVGLLVAQVLGSLVAAMSAFFVTDLDTLETLITVLAPTLTTLFGGVAAACTTPLLVATYADLRARAEGTTTPHLAYALGIHANGF
ncbi:hypothetical protein Val02_07640 [Virgisporangium aliadipatigenens]|uniref:Glycerophosphoryl diester phosphodiesterase membrane domain-containing protein n=1 Tax=Virgisporangium aliadipatigenens TaxID=741659 RepID=A0A8J3YGN3_9ACTN|nr:hypothetical protein [Virgisporangium aliadipatigenens]GIJ43878.1 hypothetical protein Val02_07640 [Virgisporangium aliadipatigenens]